MSDTPRPAPYPADTRAKGWRFELDYEKIDQSDTWDIANEIPLAQHCLLLMWYVAWKQEPCGSLPADDATLRVKCKVPAKLWPTLRPVLLRGWWLAEDGRLYHDTVTARVLEMLEYRRKTAERVAKHKAAMREQHSGNALPAREQHSKNDTGTGTGTNLREEEKEKTPRKRAAAPECPADVDSQVWEDWLTLRRKKSAPVTATVIDGARSESAKAGMTIEAFLRVWCRRGSQGLEAEWLKPAERGSEPTYRERDSANAAARIHEMTGGLVSAKSVPITRRNDVLQEIFDATPRLTA